MSIFASEFPVSSSIDKAKFVAAVLAWLRGIKKSTVLSTFDTKEIHDDDVWLETPTGETLSLKSYEDHQKAAFGARHELPDADGRRWRTECVLFKLQDQAYLRVRGQCVTTNPEAGTVAPLKPHLITQSIEDGWAVSDGQLAIQSNPHHLSKQDLPTASAVIAGNATSFLPCIYVSRNNDNSLPLDVASLAKKSSGVAHVIVEPDRGFSFKLMEACDGTNPYGGAIGIVTPDGKQIGRLFRKNGENRKQKTA